MKVDFSLAILFGPDFPKLTGLLEMTEENIP